MKMPLMYIAFIVAIVGLFISLIIHINTFVQLGFGTRSVQEWTDTMRLLLLGTGIMNLFLNIVGKPQVQTGRSLPKQPHAKSMDPLNLIQVALLGYWLLWFGITFGLGVSHSADYTISFLRSLSSGVLLLFARAAVGSPALLVHWVAAPGAPSRGQQHPLS